MTLPNTTPSTTAAPYEIPDLQAFASLAMLILHLVIITCALGYAHATTVRQTVGFELAQGGPDLPTKTRTTAASSNVTVPPGLRLAVPADPSRLVRAL